MRQAESWRAQQVQEESCCAAVQQIFLHSPWTSGRTLSGLKTICRPEDSLLLSWYELGLLGFLAVGDDPREPSPKFTHTKYTHRCPQCSHRVLPTCLSFHPQLWWTVSHKLRLTLRDSIPLQAGARHQSALLLSQDLVGHHSYLLSLCVSTARSTRELGQPFHLLLLLCSYTSLSHIWASQYIPQNIRLSKAYALSFVSSLIHLADCYSFFTIQLISWLF